MPYFDKLTPAQLRILQGRSAARRREKALLRYRTALVLFETMHDIKAVAKYFGVSDNMAYKLVAAGRKERIIK